MDSIIKFPKAKPRPPRLDLLKAVAQRTAEETGATVAPHLIENWLEGRPELLECNEVHALRAAEHIGIWVAWRMGGRPRFHWPSNAHRPDLPPINQNPRI
jgi:hypothetical protein